MRRPARRFRLVLLLPLALVAGCGVSSEEPPIALRLVDLYEPGQVSGRAAPALPPERREWRFDGPTPSPPPAAFAATRGWGAGPGVAGLAIRDGALAGASTTDFPILHLERREGLDDHDQVHSLEVRMRASAGANMSVALHTPEKLDPEEVIAQASAFPWMMTTPIVPGETMRTYVLRRRRGLAVSSTRHILIRPTDAAGASFAIESVRLITRREHLAGLPSGVGWQGLGEIYHETLISRAPETIRMTATLPDRPWLDLSLGTVEEGPLTFRIEVVAAGARAGGPRAVVQRTVTTPQRWEPVAVDLPEHAGRTVELSLTVVAEHAGTIGLWGSPAVRSRGAMPRAAVAGAGEAPQGIILVWSDTTRSDHLSLYGYARDTTPVLRRLASEGTLFDHCVSQATWTKVATPSLFTSLHPTSHTVKEFSDRLPSSAVTLAEVLREAGYATLSMSSVLFTGAFTNLHQGFDEVHEDTSLPDPESSKTARHYVDRLLPWLEAHRDVPFFVFLHVTDPHDPYRPEPPYDTLWADASKNDEHERHARDVRRVIAEPLRKAFGMPTEEELVRAGLDPRAYVAHDMDWHDGSIRGMDVELGRLIERIRELDLGRRTLFVFTGDHGEEFLEHGRMFHGQSVYGELTSVPLLVWWPGAVAAGAVVREPVRIIDLMPTLLDVTGLPSPPGMQGRSLAPLLRGAGAGAGESPARRAGLMAREAGGAGGAPPAIAEKLETSPAAGAAPPPHDTQSFAIVWEGWKLVHNEKRPAGSPEYELYDAGADRLDQRDVAARHPDVVKRLANELARLRVEALAARLPADAEAAESLSPEELERLRSLGYIQ